MIVLIGNF